MLASRSVLLCVLLLAPAAAQEAPLRLSATPGAERRVVLTIERLRARALAGRTLQEATLGVTLRLRERVESVGDDGAAQLTLTVEGVTGHLKASMIGLSTPRFAYDSAQPDPKSPLAPLRHVVGEAFTLTQAADGAVTALSGGDALRDAVLAGAEADGTSYPMMGELLTRMTSVLGDRALQDAWTALQGVLGEGERWTRERREQVPELGLLASSVAVRVSPDGEGAVLRQEASGQPRLLSADPDAAGEDASDVQLDAVALEGEASLSGGRIARATFERRIDARAKSRLPGARLKLTARTTLTWSAEPVGKRYF